MHDSSSKVSQTSSAKSNVSSIAPDGSTLAALHTLNTRYVYVRQLAQVVRIPTAAHPEIDSYHPSTFINSLESQRKKVARKWLDWAGRNDVYKLTYAPGKPQFFDDLLNTWLPSIIEPKKGDITPFNQYLDHIFASDSTHRDWFIAWLAYQFQHPGVKLHSAVVLWSTETATGKSLFGYTMAELFGMHNFAEINEGELHGSFNFWAARKQFVMGEEIKGSNAQKQADFLKTLITRKTVTINTKNTPHYTLPDCINYFFTSNRENAFLLDSTDRRFFVHRLLDKKLNEDFNNKAFKPWIANGGHSAILHYLKHEVDLSQPLTFSGKPFDPYGHAPQTLARKAMIDAGREEIDVWIDDLLEHEGRTFKGTEWELATAEDLYEAFTARFPRARVTYKAVAGKIRNAFRMVRGGNLVKLPSGENKRLFGNFEVMKSLEGAPLETVITSYQVGRE